LVSKLIGGSGGEILWPSPKKKRGLASNPVLLLPAGYLGMAVWHGGLSVSATSKSRRNRSFFKVKVAWE